MLLGHHYADWRPVATQRIPVVLIGVASAVGGGLLACVLAQGFGGFIAVGIGSLASRWTIGWLAERRLAHLRDDPEEDQFAVALRLSREVVYGYDEGLLSFVDGWLVYSGRRCSFSVRTIDLLDIASEGNRTAIIFPGQPEPCEASFQTAHYEALSEAVDQWTSGQMAAGTSVFPPVLPDTAAFHTGRLWFGSAIASAVAGVIVAFIPAIEGHRSLTLVLEFIAIGIAFYSVQVREALSRIASGLPYRRRPLSRLLGIELPRVSA